MYMYYIYFFVCGFVYLCGCMGVCNVLILAVSVKMLL